MQAMILAAGLGTRLRPWTLEHPKALVPVGGVPMLERVVERLRDSGATHIVVNVHHFASQVVDFLRARDFGVRIDISDETGRLLDTGGGLAAALPLFAPGPVLVHNVDILSNAHLGEFAQYHKESGAAVTLLCSDRDSSRKLAADARGRLAAWHNLATGEWRPADAARDPGLTLQAFSGVYILGQEARMPLQSYAARRGPAFPVMDWLLSPHRGCTADIRNIPGLRLLDIGKPHTLAKAEKWMES